MPTSPRAAFRTPKELSRRSPRTCSTRSLVANPGGGLKTLANHRVGQIGCQQPYDKGRTWGFTPCMGGIIIMKWGVATGGAGGRLDKTEQPWDFELTNGLVRQMISWIVDICCPRIWKGRKGEQIRRWEVTRVCEVIGNFGQWFYRHHICNFLQKRVVPLGWLVDILLLLTFVLNGAVKMDDVWAMFVRTCLYIIPTELRALHTHLHYFPGFLLFKT